MNDQCIVIKPVANGFIVRLPMVQSDPMERMLGVVAKQIKRANKDDVLAAIDEVQEQKATNEMKLVPEKCEYIFPTFVEVVAFLRLQYE